MTESARRCGFVALAGRPNVGKSTLVNRLIGSKISIVTPKPQTTRHRIVGVRNDVDTQFLFVDTPGLQSGRQSLMGQTMNRNAETSMADADIVLFVVDSAGITPADEHVLETIKRHDVPIVAVLNKIDRIKARSKLLPLLDDLSKRHTFKAVVPIAALDGDNVEALLAVLREAMPEGPWLYPDDQLSDRGDAFRAGELIREKLMMALEDEVPYGLAVEIDRMGPGERGMHIDATIWVERESQKPIVIGKKGERLKEIGRAARLDIRGMLRQRVHLTLWVKVKKNWSDNERSLQSLGYEITR